MSRAAKILGAVGRRAGQLPGGQQSVGRLAARLRTSRTARKVVSRMFDFDDSGIGGTFFLGAGNVIGGVGLDNLPVIIVSLVGAADDDVPELVEAVAQEQVLTGGFRPVILIDADHFGVVRQYGYAVEHVVPRAGWSGDVASADAASGDTASRDAGSWDAYLAQRLRRMRRDYSAAGFVDLAHAREAGLLFLSTLDTAG